MRWFVVYLLFITTSLFGQERILNYHVRIDVLPNADIIVEESIRVRAEGDKIKRGIFRALPLKAKEKSGKIVKTQYEILDVRSDAPGGGYFTEKQGDYLMLYVGDADVYLDPGVYNYTLKYQVKAQVGFFEKYDEIYWNATGNKWEFQIDSVSAYVIIPSGSKQIQHAAYTGEYGDAGKDYSTELIDGGSAVLFKTTRTLQNNEGLTVSVAWPKGFVTPPPPPPPPVFGPHTYMIIAALGLILVLIYYLWAWNKVGRDPEMGPIIPLFAPPDDLSPSATRYLWKNRFDDKNFTAALVRLAIKGYIRIEEKDDDYTLHLLKSDGKDFELGEKKILDNLFSTSDSVKLNSRNYERPLNAKNALRMAVEVDYNKGFFKRNILWFLPGVFLTLITLAGMLVLGELEEEQIGFTIWIFFWTLGTGLLVYFTVMAWTRRERSRWFLSFFVLPFLGGEIIAAFFYGMSMGWTSLFSLLALMGANILFFHLLQAPTLKGSKILARIEGFRQYLTVAETERLAVLHPPEKTPALFERFLPYAIALNAEKAWGEQFNEVLEKAMRNNEYRPTWYTGSMMHGGFDSRSFADSLGTSFNSNISDYSSAPSSSSGSSGGGSSGGGGGGGGGGGW